MEKRMADKDRPVNWTIVRERLLRGANQRQGTSLTVYEAHYLLQLLVNLAMHSSRSS
jgi:hypothetical protein